MKNKQEESDLWSEERRFWESGCTCICGADEAARWRGRYMLQQ